MTHQYKYPLLEKIMTFRKVPNFVAICLSMAAAAVALPASATPVNLVTNGDFETVTNFVPDNSGAAYQYVGENSDLRPANNHTSPALFGWVTHTTDRGVILFKNGYQPVAGGTYAIQLENYTDNISQTVQTVAGHTYLLAYDLSAFQAPNEFWPSYVQIRLNGNVVDYSPTVATNSYTRVEYTFTATGATDLAIWSIGYYPQLDNISVTDTATVPEPASLLLLALAAGLGFASRRRRANKQG